MSERGQSRFLFVGNQLWLDLVNTEVISAGERVDLIGGFGDLVDWLRDAGVVGGVEVEELVRRWGEAAAESARALDAARRFRATLRDLAERMSSGEPVPGEAVEAINGFLARPVRRTQVRPADGGFRIETGWSFEQPEDLLAPVAESIRDCLCSTGPALVRKCRNARCILYFHDTTKNRQRAWCSMSACGNRTKVAAHYRRRRGQTD